MDAYHTVIGLLPTQNSHIFASFHHVSSRYRTSSDKGQSCDEQRSYRNQDGSSIRKDKEEEENGQYLDPIQEL